MSVWNLDRVARALRAWGIGARDWPTGSQPLTRVWTDTRTAAAGDVFVALRGERFDAHDFLADAVARGVGALVVSNPVRAHGLGVPYFTVPDTLAALGALGAWWRTKWGGTMIAIAGSNGKTTTREMVRAALAPRFVVHATTGNLNNQVGVPLTLLSIPMSASVAVVELGTSRRGEVKLLQRMVAPDVGVVTSIGEEHLEGLRDLEGVLREETAVFQDVALAVTPALQPEVAFVARRLAGRVVEAGLDSGDFRPDTWGIGSDGRGWLTLGSTRLTLRLAGVHNLRNAMLALAVSRAFDVPDEDAVAGLAAVEPVSMRGQWLDRGSLTIINDAYNANPASMREAISLMNALATDRPKVIVLGSMRELGPAAATLHDEIAARALASPAVIVAGVEDFVRPLRLQEDRTGRVVTAPDVPALWKALAPVLPRNAVVLLKGSRGMRLEQLVPMMEAWADERIQDD